MVPHFIGRDKECANIIDHLSQATTQFVNVWGSPGFGKTSVATAVGHKLDSQGLTVQFSSLRGVERVDEMARKMLNLSQQTFQASNHKQSSRDLVMQWLSSTSTPLLLLLDNVDDLLESDKQTFVQFLQDILTSCKTVKLLCTSQESLEFMNQKCGTYLIRIQPLDKSSSRKLVQAFLPNVTDKESNTLGHICGNIPIALRLVCSVLNDGDLSLEDFVSELTISNEGILEATDMPGYPDDLRLKVLIDHCFQNLSSEEQKAFVCLSVFSDSFDVAAASTVLNTKGKLAAKRVLGVLVRKSLLQHSNSVYSIHPLLQSFGETVGKEKMEKDFQDAKLRFYGHFLAKFETLNEQFLGGQSSLAFQQAQKNQQNIVQSLLKGIRTDEHYTTVVHLLCVADIFVDSIFWNDGAQWEYLYDEAIKAAQEREQALHWSQLLVSKAFGQLAWGEEGSARLLSQAQGHLKSLLVEVPAEIKGKLLCYQGIDLLVHGKTKEGVTLLKDGYLLSSQSAFNVSTKILTFQVLALCDDNIPDTLKSFDKQICGQTQNTVLYVPDFPMFSRGDNNSELSKKMTKEDQPFVLQIVYLLGAVCDSLKSPKVKQRLANFVLQIRKQIEKSQADISCDQLYITVSSILNHLGFHKEALQSCQKIVEAQRKAFGEHMQTANSLDSLGVTPCGHSSHCIHLA